MLCCIVTISDPFVNKKKKISKKNQLLYEPKYYYTKDFVRIYNHVSCVGHPYHIVGKRFDHTLPRKHETCFNDVGERYYFHLRRLMMLGSFPLPKELLGLIKENMGIFMKPIKIEYIHTMKKV